MMIYEVHFSNLAYAAEQMMSEGVDAAITEILQRTTDPHWKHIAENATEENIVAGVEHMSNQIATIFSRHLSREQKRWIADVVSRACQKLREAE